MSDEGGKDGELRAVATATAAGAVFSTSAIVSIR